MILCVLFSFSASRPSTPPVLSLSLCSPRTINQALIQDKDQSIRLKSTSCQWYQFWDCFAVEFCYIWWVAHIWWRHCKYVSFTVWCVTCFGIAFLEVKGAEIFYFLIIFVCLFLYALPVSSVILDDFLRRLHVEKSRSAKCWHSITYYYRLPLV